MRRTSALLLSSMFTSAMVVLPATTVPAAAPVPVSPVVRTYPLAQLDAAAQGGTSGAGGAGRPAATSRMRPVVATAPARRQPFSAVGVTWRTDNGVAVAVAVRTRTGGRWTDWTELEVQATAADTAADADGAGLPARAGSDPLFVGPSDGIQVRMDAGRIAPRDVRLVLIDPGASAADRHATTAVRRTFGRSVAQAAEQQPAYVSRAAWGADETLRSCTPDVASGVKGGILHNTATGNDYSASQSAAVMRSMYAYHTRSLGWCDLGYNFVVDKFGTLFEGRYGGVEKAVIGAHTGGFNTSTFGVSMIGNYDLVTPPAAMLATVAKVFAWKLGLHRLDPTGTTTYVSAGGSATKHPAGTVVTMPVISGHRDYSTKSCPGNFAYPLLPSIRSAVAGRMSDAVQVQTALTLGTSPATITYGAVTTIRGRLTAADGTAMAGQTVRLYFRKRGTSEWRLLSTRTTAADGTFGGTHPAASHLDYTARFDATDRYGASTSREAGVNVAVAVSSGLSAGSVRRNGTVTLRGIVAPNHPGQTVTRQQLINGAWSNVATATVSSIGAYSFVVQNSYPGTKYYRVVRAADGDHLAGVSSTRVLTVK